MRATAAAAKAKPDPPSDGAGVSIDLSPEYSAALEKWRAERQRMRELNRGREQLQQGLSFVRTDPPAERVRHLVDQFDRDVLAKIRRSPRRALLELEEITDEIVDRQSAYVAANEEFQQAKAAEAARIAALFRVRHIAAVKDLVKAVEALNAAIIAERAIHRECDAVLPGSVNSSSIPDWSSDLSEMSLAEWHGVAAVWMRRAQQWLEQHDA